MPTKKVVLLDGVKKKTSLGTKTWTWPETEAEQEQLYAKIYETINEIPFLSRITSVRLNFSAYVSAHGDGLDIFKIILSSFITDDQGKTQQNDLNIYDLSNPSIRIDNVLNTTNHWDQNAAKVHISLPTTGFYFDYPYSMPIPLFDYFLPYNKAGEFSNRNYGEIPGKFKCYFEDSNWPHNLYQIGNISIEWDYEELDNSFKIEYVSQPFEAEASFEGPLVGIYDKVFEVETPFSSSNRYTFNSWTTTPHISYMSYTPVVGANLFYKFYPAISETLINNIKKNNNTLKLVANFTDSQSQEVQTIFIPDSHVKPYLKVFNSDGTYQKNYIIDNIFTYTGDYLIFYLEFEKGFQLSNIQVTSLDYDLIQTSEDEFQLFIGYQSGDYCILNIYSERIPCDLHYNKKWIKNKPVKSNVFIQKKNTNNLISPNLITYQKGEEKNE